MVERWRDLTFLEAAAWAARRLGRSFLRAGW